MQFSDYLDAIRTEVERRWDASLGELRDWLFDTRGITASLGLMHKIMVRLGLTLKKSWAVPPSRNAMTLP